MNKVCERHWKRENKRKIVKSELHGRFYLNYLKFSESLIKEIDMKRIWSRFKKVVGGWGGGAKTALVWKNWYKGV